MTITSEALCWHYMHFLQIIQVTTLSGLEMSHHKGLLQCS